MLPIAYSTAEKRARHVRQRMAEVRRLRAGGPPTENERHHARLIRERLNLGDRVTEAQVEFLRLVEAALKGGKQTLPSCTSTLGHS